jgi:tripartite-type tricarboxylate transporter receptor subunit TctC
MATRNALSTVFPLLSAVLCSGFSSLASAQSYPSKPLQLIVPYAPGAAYDLVGRIIADGARESLGTIVVENRPGGSGGIAAAQVKRAAPDGYTLLLGGNPYVVGEALNIKRSHNFFEDFEQIGHLCDAPFLLTVNREAIPVNTLREFVDYVKARPGKFVYITPGSGTTHHFGMEALKLETGLDVLHVPYKSIAQGVGDMVAGRVHMIMSAYPAVGPHMKTGKFKTLATIGAKRSSQQPDIPTFAEAGVPGVELVSWLGVAVPSGTPRAVINRLNSALNAMVQTPLVKEKLATQGLEPGGGTPEEISKRIRVDYARYVRLIKAAGITSSD